MDFGSSQLWCRYCRHFFVLCAAMVILSLGTGGTSGCGKAQKAAPSDTQSAGSLDADNDGIPDASDNCPSFPNSRQIDTDGNGIGDLCEEVVVPEPMPQEPSAACDPLFVCDADHNADCSAASKSAEGGYVCIDGCCAPPPDCKTCSTDPADPSFGICGPYPCVDGCCQVACPPDDPSCGGSTCDPGVTSCNSTVDCGGSQLCENACCADPLVTCPDGCAAAGGVCQEVFPLSQYCVDTSFEVCPDSGLGAGIYCGANPDGQAKCDFLSSQILEFLATDLPMTCEDSDGCCHGP